MYEHRTQRLLSRRQFGLRVLRSAGFSAAVVVVSLAIGAVGYHSTEGLPWVDAVLNASMILTGMGPVDHLVTTPGKLFATFYCLLAGLGSLTAISLLLAPVIHRGLHVFHVEMQEREAARQPARPRH